MFYRWATWASSSAFRSLPVSNCLAAPQVKKLHATHDTSSSCLVLEGVCWACLPHSLQSFKALHIFSLISLYESCRERWAPMTGESYHRRHVITGFHEAVPMTRKSELQVRNSRWVAIARGSGSRFWRRRGRNELEASVMSHVIGRVDTKWSGCTGMQNVLSKWCLIWQSDNTLAFVCWRK